MNAAQMKVMLIHFGEGYYLIAMDEEGCYDDYCFSKSDGRASLCSLYVALFAHNLFYFCRFRIFSPRVSA